MRLSIYGYGRRVGLTEYIAAVVRTKKNTQKMSGNF